ncbi:hypothetical protein [Aquibacillus salsiterrae]|uniref:Uncharacterized protein n=1 Tax=Aquibacillus salsiterrae TaxID=2950439 RepID=A0A9X3WDH7_9BACI|nr:hypothetical protein [Aquibacillus salsiterrae]MDC3416718.1 hypothetical protein [Aquibacillus salsiterrae]
MVNKLLLLTAVSFLVLGPLNSIVNLREHPLAAIGDVTEPLKDPAYEDVG